MRNIYGFVIGQIVGILLFGVCFNAIAQPDLAIDSLSLVSQKRLSRTVFEYTYTAVAINNGDDAEVVRATLSINSQETTKVT